MFFLSPQKRKIGLLKKYFRRNPEVVMAFLFGSRASGRQAAHSDWDIAVYFNPRAQGRLEWEEARLQYPHEERVWNDCIDILKTDDVDLVALNRAPVGLADSALLGIPLVVKDRALWLNFMLTVSAEASDYRRFVKEFFEISQRSNSISETDAQILRKTIQFIEIQMALYKDYTALTWQIYQADLHKRNDVERWVENVVNAAVDISKIILASKKKAIPDTYRQTIEQAASELGLEESIVGKFENWIKLRNILAHEYLDIRWERILDFIQNSEICFQQLITAAKHCLK